MKKTILMLSDHPFHFSGVAIQTKMVMEALLNSGKYKIISLGGAKFHSNMSPVRTDEYGDDLIIIPVENYGTQDLVRSIMKQNTIDAVWFMTDPRYWEFLFQMEDEIRPLAPMIYYHVWDNYPVPDYNKSFYLSCDSIASISRLTQDIVTKVSPETNSKYIPHTTDFDVFKNRRADPKTSEIRKKMTGPKDKFVVLWSNRNQKRKLPGDFMFMFSEWLNKVGKDKAVLIMKTLPIDVHSDGYDLIAIKTKLGLTDDQIKFVTDKLDPESLSHLYSAADLCINIANAEGFGLTTFEALACETPILVNMTGGLSEQVTDGKNDFGFKVEPATRTVIGNPQTPYIYEDVVSHTDVIRHLDDAFTLWSESKETYRKMGTSGRQHLLKNYSREKFDKDWVELLDKTIESHYNNPYKFWEIKEV